MKYTVTYSVFAERQLTEIWMSAPDPQAVTDASRDIDRTLGSDADQIGMPNADGWRGLVASPLAITFKVSEDDRMVTVLSVRYRP